MTSVFMLEKYHYYPEDSATCTHKFVYRAVSGGVRRNWSGGPGRLSAIGLTLFIPDVRPEIIPMLPAHLGEKTDMEKLFTWCVSNLIFSATT